MVVIGPGDAVLHGFAQWYGPRLQRGVEPKDMGTSYEFVPSTAREDTRDHF